MLLPHEEARCSILTPPSTPDPRPRTGCWTLDDSWSVARLSGFFDGQAPSLTPPCSFLVCDEDAPIVPGCQDDDVIALLPLRPRARGGIVTQVQRWDRLSGGLSSSGGLRPRSKSPPADAHLRSGSPAARPAPEAAARSWAEIVSRGRKAPHAAAQRIHAGGADDGPGGNNATIINAIQRIAPPPCSAVAGEARADGGRGDVEEGAGGRLAVGGIQTRSRRRVGHARGLAGRPAWAEAVRDLLLFTERARRVATSPTQAVRRRFRPTATLLEVRRHWSRLGSRSGGAQQWRTRGGRRRAAAGVWGGRDAGQPRARRRTVIHRLCPQPGAIRSALPGRYRRSACGRWSPHRPPPAWGFEPVPAPPTPQQARVEPPRQIVRTGAPACPAQESVDGGRLSRHSPRLAPRSE